MLTLASCPTPSPRTAHEITDGQAILVNLDTGFLFSLNATGAFLWQRLDGHTSLGVIAADLAAAYEVDAAITGPDVLELAHELLKEGLIQPG
jgi:hypothetical protein